MAVETKAYARAEQQHGVVARRQVSLSDRQIRYRVEQGRWHEELPGVYRLAGVPKSWRQQIQAALLWVKDGVLSHHSAARIHGFPHFHEDPALHLTTAARDVRADSVKVHYAQRLQGADVVVVDGCRVTSIPRTLCDLANRKWGKKRWVAECLDAMLAEKRVSFAMLLSFCRRNRGRRGVAVLRTLVYARMGFNGVSESRLERKGLQLIEDAGLPRPKVQHPERLSKRRARLDLAYPAVKVAIELDGYSTHSTVTSFEKDRHRQNHLIAENWRVLRWTWKAVHETPHLLLKDLAKTLRAAGLQW